MPLISLVKSALDVLGEAPQELQVVDARVLVERHYPSLSVDRPALIGHLTDSPQCQRLSQLLRLAYPDAHGVIVVSGVGSESCGLQSLPLDRLGEVVLGAQPSLLYLPPLPCSGAVETFQDTVAHLRASDGCLWDRMQTHRSMRQGFQEEAYEVLDALDRGDLEALKEELGDVLLHVLMQAQIASERSEFRMSDVICRVNAKIVHRHPHVFGDLSVSGVDEVLVNWEELKRQEKQTGQESPSALDSVSPVMPALARAQSVQRHVDRTGFGSAELDELASRVSETLPDLLMEKRDRAREALLGNMLFDLANLARKLDIDAESALREANSRFERRFRALEHTLGGADSAPKEN